MIEFDRIIQIDIAKLTGIFAVSAISVIVAIAVISCKSPLDIDTIRDKDTLYDPNNKPAVIKVNPSILDFGTVFINDISEKSFDVENISAEDLTIEKISFKNSKNYFNLSSEFSKFQLSTSGINKTKSISITFNPQKTGYLFDTIQFNDYKKPFLIVKSVVPDVYAKDLKFEDTQSGGLSGKVLRIYNETDKPVLITKFEINNNKTIFFEEPKIIVPFEIEANSFKNIVINFNPSQVIDYSSEILISAQTSGIVDESIQLSGKGK